VLCPVLHLDAPPCYRKTLCEGFWTYAIEYGMLLALVHTGRMKFLQATAAARFRATGTPRWQRPMSEQPHATFARRRSPSPDAALTTGRRCTFPRGSHAPPAPQLRRPMPPAPRRHPTSPARRIWRRREIRRNL
jgi:hypothetical protein